jgi:hypothetical protein
MEPAPLTDNLTLGFIDQSVIAVAFGRFIARLRRLIDAASA